MEEAASADHVSSAPGVVLPGVGAFGAAMSRLDTLGLSTALRERVDAGRATLAVCVGMQLLGRDSEESPGASGLAVLDESVSRFGDGVSVPQMGWNSVEPVAPTALLAGVEPGAYAYFIHSYAVPYGPYTRAVTDYGVRFSAVVEQRNFYGTQFHPERSSRTGAQILDNFLKIDV